MKIPTYYLSANKRILCNLAKGFINLSSNNLRNLLSYCYMFVLFMTNPGFLWPIPDCLWDIPVCLYDIPFCLWDIPVCLWDISVCLWESLIVCVTSMFVFVLFFIKTCHDCCLLRLFFIVMAAYANNFWQDGGKDYTAVNKTNRNRWVYYKDLP